MRNKNVTESLAKWNGFSFIGITSRDYQIVESKLSDILDITINNKYILSSTACEGILKRASDRNKKLPPILKTALERQVQGINIENIKRSNTPIIYSLSSKGSNAMKSNNPNSGFAEVSVFRTIDTNGGNPICNQGGNIIVEPIAFAQNQRMEVRDLNNKAGTVTVLYSKNQTHVADPVVIEKEENKEVEYIIRRLSPKECGKLQGFPSDYCDNLEENNPTEEQVKEWKDIINYYNKTINSNAKERTDKQVESWLKDPYSDSAEYKLWGNGVALPCVNFIMKELVDFLNE